MLSYLPEKMSHLHPSVPVKHQVHDYFVYMCLHMVWKLSCLAFKRLQLHVLLAIFANIITCNSVLESNLIAFGLGKMYIICVYKIRENQSVKIFVGYEKGRNTQEDLRKYMV